MGVFKKLLFSLYSFIDSIMNLIARIYILLIILCKIYIKTFQLHVSELKIVDLDLKLEYINPIDNTWSLE